MLKSFVRRLARRAGYDLVRVSDTWRGEPVSSEVAGRMSPGDWAIARQVEAYTATSLARVAALIRAVRYLARYRIPGDLVECGVWRGGSTMAAALTLTAEGDTSRRLFLFDTFAGMPAPTAADRDAAGTPAEAILRGTPPREGVWCYADLAEVTANMARTGYPADRVRFVQGRVEDTLPHPDLERLALVRLDTDWYASTRHELTHLCPRLSAGGVLIVDDYGHWQGARRATDEYLRGHPDVPLLLTPIDGTGVQAVKALTPRPDPPCGS